MKHAYKADIKEFQIYKNNQCIEKYNKHLLQSHGLDTRHNRRKILDLHIQRNQLFDNAKALNSTDYEELAKIRDELEKLEYKLQVVWGFPLSAKFHSYWYKLPHCTCPKLDNEELKGSYQRIFTRDCPYHGVNSR